MFCPAIDGRKRGGIRIKRRLRADADIYAFVFDNITNVADGIQTDAENPVFVEIMFFVVFEREFVTGGFCKSFGKSAPGKTDRRPFTGTIRFD